MKKCERCHGRGCIQQCTLMLDDVPAGQPQTATVIEVKDPQFCPECGGSGEVDDAVER